MRRLTSVPADLGDDFASTGLNRRYHPPAKINGIRSAHPMLVSNPARILNQNPAELEIPNLFGLPLGAREWPIERRFAQ